MELIYSMRRKPLKCEPPQFGSVTDPEVIRPICTISTANIIAFSSPTELSDSEGDTWGGHVYVCDLDTPWDSHKVTSTAFPVSALEWDGEGKLLLVATTVGEVSVYGQKEYLLNEWTCLYNASFPGEHIIKSAFFHNGRRFVLVDKKPDSPINEKIQMLRPMPTLKGFGGVACEGACIITATGLVAALTPPAAASGSDPPRAVVATECLRSTRDHITAAATTTAHKNGNLLIAAVCVGPRMRSCVRCYVCSCSRPPPTLSVQPLPTIYLLDGDVPASISWCLREDTDSILIAGNTLTLWKCTERANPVHKLLSKGPIQGSTTPGGGQKPSADCFNTVVWQKTAVWAVEGEAAVCVTSARLALGAPHAVLATPRAVHLLARDTHHYLSSRPVVTGGGDAPPVDPPKKPKYGPGASPGGAGAGAGGAGGAGGGPAVTCAEMSALGGALVCVDALAQLHVFRLPQPWADIPSPLSVQHATSLLEYSMVSGLDCLDILLTLKHNIIEPIYERLTENFQRQPQSFQQYYFHSWLKLRIALCRVVGRAGAASSAAALAALQAAGAAWAAACAALRADDRPAPDAPLAPHSLHALLEDHDKSLLAFEAKTDVGSEAAALQALRLPLQRALDIALTALVTFAHQHQQQHHQHGYELWSDPGAVTLLRKLCVVARLAGRNAEPLSRALARLAAGSPKQDFIEECLTLGAASPGRVWECLPRCSVAAPHGLAFPLYFEYGVEPEALRYTPEPPPYAQCDATPPLAMDSIRYMHLGGGRRAARWRQCARCGARALPAARLHLQRAYDARFLPACRCGGRWTLFSNI